MQPIFTTGLLLLSLTLTLALLAMALARGRHIRRSNASAFTNSCTVLMLATGYGLIHSAWTGLHLQTLDYASFMLILALVSHATIWAAIAFQLNKPELQQDFGDSFMVSMLYADQP